MGVHSPTMHSAHTPQGDEQPIVVVVTLVVVVVVGVVVVVRQVPPQHCSGAQAGMHSPKLVIVAPSQNSHASQVQLRVPPQPLDPVPQSNETHVRGVQQAPLKTTCPGPQPQTPNIGLAFPGPGAGFTHLRLQQLTSVVQVVPIDLQPPARTSEAVLKTSITASVRRASEKRPASFFMRYPLAPREEGLNGSIARSKGRRQQKT